MLDIGQRQRAERSAPDIAGSALAGRPTPGQIAVLRRHPLFPDVMAAALRVPVDLYRGNRVMNFVLSDRGRYFLSAFALYLHYAGDAQDPGSGLTAVRLQALCAAQGFCTASRAAAMIRLMQWSGCLAGEPHARLTPTEKLIEAHRLRWRGQLQAAAIAFPDVRRALGAFDHPAFLPAFTLAAMGQHLAGLRFYDYAPALELFGEREAGLFVLISMVLAAEPGDTLPPRKPFTVPIARIAARFHVSRAHVARMLRSATEAGLLERQDTETRFRMTHRLRDAVETLTAAQSLFHRAGALAAMEAVERAA